MYPILTFAVGGVGVAVATYRLCLMLAAVAAFGLGLAVATRRGLPPLRVAAVLVAAAAAVPVGARALDFVTKPAAWSGESPLSLSLEGFSLYGGLVLATGTFWTACHAFRLDPWRLADAAAPGLGVGICLVRVGCFCAGCCFGRETGLPWGMTFPPGSEAHLHQALANGGLGALAALGGVRPVHPTQLYEALAGLLSASLALWLHRRAVPTGVAALGVTLLFDAFRLGNHFLREQSSTLGVPDWFYPAIYVAVLVLAAAALRRRLIWGRSTPLTPARWVANISTP